MSWDAQSKAFTSYFFNRAFMRNFQLQEDNLGKFIQELMKSKILSPESIHSNVTIKSWQCEPKRPPHKSHFSHNLEQTFQDQLKDILQLPCAEEPNEVRLEPKISQGQLIGSSTQSYTFMVNCQDQNYIKCGDKILDVQVILPQQTSKPALLLQFSDSIATCQKQLSAKTKELEQRNLMIQTQVSQQLLYIKEISDVARGIIDAMASLEVARKVKQIEKYLQIMYYINLALQGSLNLAYNPLNEVHSSQIHLVGIIKHIRYLLSSDFKKSQNIIQCKINKSDDEVLVSDDLRLKEILTYILSLLNQNSKQNTITIIVSSFNDQVVKLTFQSSNLQFEQDQHKFTPKSMDEKDNDTSQEQDKQQCTTRPPFAFS